jgi:uncharacterized membrane protein (DUF4010 family)
VVTNPEVTIDPDLQLAAALAVAGLIGLAVGIEREWSGHATGPAARFAGARTFLLLGLVGGTAGILASLGLVLPAAALILAASGLAVVAYAMAARRPDPDAVDGTTEAAALAVLGLGFLAGLDHLGMAAAVGAVIVLALREKSTIHNFVARLDEAELRAALQFAVLALVLLPILPTGPYGPLGGVRPRELWGVVLIVSGLNFAGYLAQKSASVAHGATISGVLAGLISSTLASLAFSRQSRDHPAGSGPLALGVISACTVLPLRLFVLTLVLSPPVTLALLPLLLPPLAAGAAQLAIGLYRHDRMQGPPARPVDERSPLRLWSAILMGVGFQVVLMAMQAVREFFGQVGVLTSAGLLGLTDMDALTFSMSRLAAVPTWVGTAALAIAIGMLANTVLKLGVVLTMGRGPFRRRAGIGLGLLGLGSLVGIWIAAG